MIKTLSDTPRCFRCHWHGGPGDDLHKLPITTSRVFDTTTYYACDSLAACQERQRENAAYLTDGYTDDPARDYGLR